jgi:inosine/xanthosine triphosphate pyrophosphatase family protein
MGVKFAGTRVKAICRLGLCRGSNDVVIAQGEFNGTIIIPKDKDHQGRDFEFFVVLDGMDKPMIDYSVEEKNKFSHRGLAMKNLIEMLKKEVK